MVKTGGWTISVIGASVCSEQEAEWAEEVGAHIGRRGHILLCGGRGGVMAAACKGARREGGWTVGVLPGSDRSGANPHLDVALPTGLGEARNLIVARGGDAVIAVGGSYGTLSEIALALKGGRPVVGLGTWSATAGSGTEAEVIAATSPEEAVDLACAKLNPRGVK